MLGAGTWSGQSSTGKKGNGRHKTLVGSLRQHAVGREEPSEAGIIVCWCWFFRVVTFARMHGAELVTIRGPCDITVPCCCVLHPTSFIFFLNQPLFLSLGIKTCAEYKVLENHRWSFDSCKMSVVTRIPQLLLLCVLNYVYVEDWLIVFILVGPGCLWWQLSLIKCLSASAICRPWINVLEEFWWLWWWR